MLVYKEKNKIWSLKGGYYMKVGKDFFEKEKTILRWIPNDKNINGEAWNLIYQCVFDFLKSNKMFIALYGFSIGQEDKWMKMVILPSNLSKVEEYVKESKLTLLDKEPERDKIANYN